jgi:hypothetical protein
MPDPKTLTTEINSHAFASAVPSTPGEAAALSARWERRGLLQRLVRVN